MDPQARSCHNPDHPVREQSGICNDLPAFVHSRKQRRYYGTIRDRTFAATQETPVLPPQKAIVLCY